MAAIAHITGCCNGQEYSIWTTCLGFQLSDAFGATTLCYDTPDSPTGPCTDDSMPPAPGQPIGDGTVAPHTSSPLDVPDANSFVFRAFRSKLGRCPRCMRLAVLLATLSIVALSVAGPNANTWPFLVATTVFLVSLVVAHSIAFSIRVMSGRRSPCNCSQRRTR
jgi:hypothetical protein